MGGLRFWFDRTFAHWRGDLTGGLTAAVVALPLALAFAVASGVEPKAGLYTA
ncbi:MAG: SulP family inorganic anion transporter, partial [Microcoleus sp.]